MEVLITENNIGEVKAATQAQVLRALEAVGLQAEMYVKLVTPVDTGRLRNSMSHVVDRDRVYIGTNVEYAVYVELGTSRMAGRHMIQNGVGNHIQEYKQIIERFLRG